MRIKIINQYIDYIIYPVIQLLFMIYFIDKSYIYINNYYLYSFLILFVFEMFVSIRTNISFLIKRLMVFFIIYLLINFILFDLSLIIKVFLIFYLNILLTFILNK